MDKSIQTGIISLDFAKAFDSFGHNILLANLRAYGVSEQFLNWFKKYLSVRVQSVVAMVDDAASQWAPLMSGVPREVFLIGPMPFTIFINDLPNASKGKVVTALYADDTKIFNCNALEED